MRNTQEFKHKKILVIGLAKSGVNVATLLHQLQANVTVNDRTPLEESVDAQELAKKGIRVVSGGHPLELLDEPFDMVVKNPGIPYSNPLVAKAVEKGLPVYTEIEIAYRVMEGTVLGITGSNGKTTTTTLTNLMLKESFPQRRTFACGNIGVPLSHLAADSKESDIYVTELSSFQLMGVEEFHPKVACIVNIFSAHLDYHGSREAYIEAKLQITKNQTADDYLVYNADFPELYELIKDKTKATLIPFSRKEVLSTGAYADDKMIYFNGEAVLPLEAIQVPGLQNVENVLAAVAISKLQGATNEGIEKAVRGFHGVKHRTQYVKTIENRKFYNDSKATNIIATQTALRSFTNQSVILIAGGLDRGNGFEELEPSLKNVREMIVYGETKEKLKATAEKLSIPVTVVHTLEEAVPKAYQVSQEGEIILLSPACASWDQFPNFEVRGDCFIDAVEKL